MRRSLLLLTLAVAAVLSGAFAGSAAADNLYRLIYLDGHMHSVASDGTGALDDLKTAALARGLDAIIVTDHTAMLTLREWRALNERARRLSEKGFLMIAGFEVTGSEGVIERDHLLAWNVRDPFVGRNARELAPEEVWPSPFNSEGTGTISPENVAKWVRYIHRHGGIAVHAHPSGSTNPSYGVDYIEVFNLRYVKYLAELATTAGMPAGQARLLSLTLNNLALYGERDLSMLVPLPGLPAPLPLRDAVFVATQQATGVGCWVGAPQAPLHSWDELLMAYIGGELRHPTFAVANSDAHNTANVSADPLVDYSDVGEAKNGVFVRRLTRGSLFNALRKGRCFATTGPGLTLTVNDKMMGQTARVEQGSLAMLHITAQGGSPSAIVTQVTIVRNGELWRVLTPMTPCFNTALSDSVEQDGYYRLEVVTVDAVSGEYQFAYSNPVFVRLGD